MKLKYIALTLAVTMFAACQQEVLELEPAPAPPAACNSCPTGATSGSASFAKFVAIGNSFVAGFQSGALYNSGQTSSMAKMIADQLACAGGATTFNQPNINSENGYNLQLSVPPSLILGRLKLFDPDGPTGPRTPAPAPVGMPATEVTCPTPVNTPAVPGIADFPAAFTGDKAALNNFGVPLIYLKQVGTALTGGPASPANPAYNPLYARFATAPGTSTILGDALGAAGSFYLIWLGIDDALLYAALGADGSYPLTPMDPTGPQEPGFTATFNNVINTMLGANPVFKGVVGNIPSITAYPYFTTVPWNTIKVDAATASTLNANMVAGYNQFIDAMVGNAIISSTEGAKRKLLTYTAGVSAPVLINDETLTNLTPYMTGPAAALLPYAIARHATSSELVPLGAGAVLGKCYADNPQAIWGVSFPLSDKYMLTYDEIVTIETRIAEYNGVINAAVNGSNNRLVVADVRTAYNSLLGASITSRGMVIDGVTIATTFAPPVGAFSEDGLHPNAKGYAYTANVFIDAINTKFGATVPHVCLNDKSGTAIPINP